MEENKKEIENLIQIIMKKRDEIEIWIIIFLVMIIKVSSSSSICITTILCLVDFLNCPLGITAYGVNWSMLYCII